MKQANAKFLAKEFVNDIKENPKLIEDKNREWNFNSNYLKTDPGLKEHKKELNKIGLDLIISNETTNAYKLIKIK